MRKIFFILSIVASTNCISQEHKCDSGYRYMQSLYTSSLRIIADTCLPDSVCKRYFKTFEKNMCGEMGIFSRGGGFCSYRQNIWDDSLGCISKEVYSMEVKGQWVEISKCLYYWLNKSVTCFSGGADWSLITSCCGHVHTERPK